MKNRKKLRQARREEGVAGAVIRAFFIIIGIILLVCMTAFTSYAEERQAWTAQDTGLQAIFISATLMDGAQTLRFSRTHDRREICNPFLGSHPSRARVVTIISASMLAHTAIAFKLPVEMVIFGEKIYPRTIWQAFWIMVETDAVQHNRRVGLGLNLHF